MDTDELITKLETSLEKLKKSKKILDNATEILGILNKGFETGCRNSEPIPDRLPCAKT